jgi:hypothetical protein
MTLKSFCAIKNGHQIEEAAHRIGEKSFLAIKQRRD